MKNKFMQSFITLHLTRKREKIKKKKIKPNMFK